MSATELDESQKKFIQAVGISNADFLKLKEAYEKERDEYVTGPGENGHPELHGLAEMAENKKNHPMEQDQSVGHYLPTKQSTKEILEIAKEQGDELDGRSLKMLDDVLYSKIAPKGGTVADIKQAITVTKGLLDLGKCLFKKYAEHLGTFGAVASLLKDVLTWGEPEKKDPVLQELGVLRNELDVLSSKMTAHFNELKAYMAEEAFFATYADNATALLEYMIRTMHGVEKEMPKAQKDFIKHYERIDPEFMVTRMLIMLERESSNPLVLQMRGAELPTNAVFNKWRDIIDSTLTQFLILEEFASGFLDPDEKRKSTIITEKIARFNTITNNFEFDLRVEKPSVEKTRNFVRRIQQDNSYPNDAAKADVIIETLDGLLRCDQYYVVVFHKDVAFSQLTTKQDQLVVSTDCGEFNVVVFWAFENSIRTINNIIGAFKQKETLSTYQGTVFNTCDGLMKTWLPFSLDQLVAKMNTYGLIMSTSSGEIAVRWLPKVEGSKWGPGLLTYDYKLKVCTFGCKIYDLFYLVSPP